MNLFEIFYSDDWCYIYLNGNLHIDNSTFTDADIFELVFEHQPFNYKIYTLSSNIEDESFPPKKSIDMIQYVG